tara:strand:+ start:2148 stop:2348 length:201 start_codon:yes stop_codon:yes gene_type:complete
VSGDLANALRLIEAEYIAYTNLTPEKHAALVRFVGMAGFIQWWRDAGHDFDRGFRQRVDRLVHAPK